MRLRRHDARADRDRGIGAGRHDAPDIAIADDARIAGAWSQRRRATKGGQFGAWRNRTRLGRHTDLVGRETPAEGFLFPHEAAWSDEARDAGDIHRQRARRVALRVEICGFAATTARVSCHRVRPAGSFANNADRNA